MLDLLFVYGTLRRGSGHPMAALLADEADCVAPGTFQGRLYDLGAYPGAVPSREPADRVRGEVYRLRRPAATLTALDHYEQCGPEWPPPTEYRREQARILLDRGTAVTAWIYLYALPTDRLVRIADGDYRR